MSIQLTPRVYVLPGGSNIGVVISDDGRAVMIDSGLNDTPARKALRFVREELGTELRAIINTHAHADHFGGNSWLVKRTDAEVHAPDIDEVTLRHPLLQPIMLYGGADPADALRTSFLVAEAGPVTGVIQPGQQQIAGVDLEAIALGGHSMNQLGYVIDGVFFCADVVFPEATLEKYPIPYLFGLTEHLAALDTASDVPCTTVVPGHGPVQETIGPLVQQNRAAIDDVIACLMEIIDHPVLADEICAELFRRMHVTITDAQAYYLLRPTVQAYLAHLERTNRISLKVQDGSVVWCPISE